MKNFVLLCNFILIGFTQGLHAQCSLSPLGIDDHTEASNSKAEYNDIVIDGNGVPYVAYQDYSMGQKCSVKKYNGTTWTTVGTLGFSAGRAEPIRMAIDKFGTPYVAYIEYSTSNKATVKKFNGTAWVTVGTAGLANTSYVVDIAIDSSGTPYISSQSGSPSKPTVQKFNGTAWAIVGPVGFSPAVTGASGGTSIAFDAGLTPYVFFQDGTLGPTVGVVWKYNGTAWVNVAPSGGFSSFGDSDLAVDSAGTPYVVVSGVSMVAKVMKFNGSAWVNVGSSSLSSGGSDYNRIAIGSNGMPFITFKEVSATKVMKFNGIGWQVIGTLTGGSYQSIALDANDQPYVAFTSMKCKVFKYSGTGWTNLNQLGISNGETEFTSIAVDNMDVPYIVYTDNANGGKGSVKKNTGTGWVSVGGTFMSSGTAHFNRIAIDNSNNPYVVYRDGSNGGKASVMKFNGSSWNYLGLSGFTPTLVSYFDIAIDNNNNVPYVVYADDFNGGKVSVVKFNGTSWVNVGSAGFSAGSASNIRISVDGNGIPYVAYTDGGNGNKTTVMKFNGTSWISVGSPGFSVGIADFTSIALDPSGTPYVAYGEVSNGDKCTVMKYDGNSWVYVGPAGFSLDKAEYISIAINSIGIPYVVFRDYLSGNKIELMKYDGTNWKDVGFSAGDSKYSNLAIGNTGKVYTIFSNDGAWVYSNAEGAIAANKNYLCNGGSLILNALGGTAGYNWSGPNGFTASVASPTIINTQGTNSGTYSVVISNGVCSNTQTVSVTVDPTCQDVWPGDANSDGLADNLDVLELGLHYTQTGASRATTSNNWQSYFANNWTGTITNGKNVNHSDCNGDGTIDSNDTLAIYNNYGSTHAFKPAQTNTVNPQLSIVPDQSGVVKGTWGTASVYLGDATTNINNINGVAFTVDFDNTLIETSSIYIEYQNSFLDAGQNLDFRKLDFANGKIFTATTHTINNNVSGNGKIATLHYQIKSALTTDQVLNLGISQANQSDAIGAIVPLTTGTATLLAMGASVGLQELNRNVISISPNPTNGSLTVITKTELQKIEIVSITGQVLLSETPTSVSHTLHLENFSNGIYFVNVYQNDRVVKREKVVLNK